MTDLPVVPPDTALARLARDLVHDCCEPHVAAHSERSFQFAGLVARAEGVELDVEVLYIGTLLHDVGLAARFAGPDRFEMRGANAARSMLLEADMDTARGGERVGCHRVARLHCHCHPQEPRDQDREPGHQHRRAWRGCRAAAARCGAKGARYLATASISIDLRSNTDRRGPRESEFGEVQLDGVHRRCPRSWLPAHRLPVDAALLRRLRVVTGHPLGPRDQRPDQLVRRTN